MLLLSHHLIHASLVKLMTYQVNTRNIFAVHIETAESWSNIIKVTEPNKTI